MTLEEKMKNESLYDGSPNVIPEELNNKLIKNKERIYNFNNSHPSQFEYRENLLHEILASVGKNCYIEPPFHANWGSNTHVGDNFYANYNLTLVDDADIYIGNNVMIAPNVILATAAHPICPELRELNYQYNLPIHIGNRVWIGAGAIILPGVSIGDDSVIGAGSVVTKDVRSKVVAAGNPCKILREISDKDYKYYYKDKEIDSCILKQIKKD